MWIAIYLNNSKQMTPITFGDPVSLFVAFEQFLTEALGVTALFLERSHQTQCWTDTMIAIIAISNSYSKKKRLTRK